MSLLRSMPSELREKIHTKRLIFSVNPGRAGSQYMANMLARIPDLNNNHEPPPYFSSAMRYVQHYPEIALHFWIDWKLPRIAQIQEPIYFEASHLFGKGFVEPLLDLGLIPDIVIMRRPQREVALSHMRIGSVPARTASGRNYLLQPDDPVLCPVEGWQSFTDYQLCFWYTVEMEERSRVYSEMIRERGGLVVETTLSEFRTKDGFKRFIHAMKLPEPDVVDWLIYEVVHRFRVDVRGRQKIEPPQFSDEELARQEAEVRSVIVIP